MKAISKNIIVLTFIAVLCISLSALAKQNNNSANIPSEGAITAEKFEQTPLEEFTENQKKSFVPKLFSQKGPSTPWQETLGQEGKIRLIDAGSATSDGTYFTSKDRIIGIQIKLKDNWKTYWKNSGESGIPVTVSFEGSKNLAKSKILWPAPHRKVQFDIENWAYQNEVIIPVILTPSDNTKPIDLKSEIKWAVCAEVCLFHDAIFSLALQPNQLINENFDDVLTYLTQVPSKLDAQKDIALESIKLSKDKIQAIFTTTKKFSDSADLFVFEKTENFFFPAPKITNEGSRITFTTTYRKLLKNADLLDQPLYLTLSDGNNSVEFTHTPKKYQPIFDTSDSKISQSILYILFAAFLGGLILNIMPCVLPIISIKALSIIKAHETEPHRLRAKFLATLAGIIFSFMVLAAAAIILKSIGHQVGWGIQFQQPSFLIFLALICLAFAMNLFGWFEVNLSSKVSDVALNKTADNKTLISNFASGAFATLLATPCTAPFLSTAITFALTSSWHSIILVFLVMSLGFGFPYIALSINPSLIRFFPKPGAWMNWVKKIMGVLLLITFFWLASVLLLGGNLFSAVILLLFSALSMGITALLVYLKKPNSRILINVIYSCLMTFAISMFFANIESDNVEMSDEWVKFSETKISEYVEQDRVVFVDVTAEWCLTCKFNKATVVKPMLPYLNQNNIVLMKADYTKPSKEISDYLSKNDVYAIPFNKVYGPNAPNGIKLNEVLSEKEIKQAIEKAKKSN